jgi:uncharacterized membrane protein
MLRFTLYGLLGWCAEIVWTACYDALAGIARAPGGKRVALTPGERLRLEGHTYLWMLPIYGLAAFLFEPVHDALRAQPWLLRGAIYTAGIFAVEYAAGLVLKRATGSCPWDYSYSRFSVGGYIRLDYAPVWFACGLLLERAHDLITRVEPAIRHLP